MGAVDGDTGGEASDTDQTTGGVSADGHEGLFERVISGNLSFVGGILGGGAAYAIGLAVTGLLFLVRIEGITAEEAIGRSEPAAVLGYNMTESAMTFVSVTAMSFYNAQGVSVRVDSSLGTDSVNLVSALELNVLLFAAIPALLLFGFGGLVALLKRADGLAGGFVSGGSVVMGYLPLVLAGALFFERSTENVEASIQLLPAIVLAGLVFPFVFGGLAGLCKVLIVDVFLGGVRERL